LILSCIVGVEIDVQGGYSVISKLEQAAETSAGGFASSPRFSRLDPRGRTIEPAVLDAAEAIGQRAVHYAENLVGDPCLGVRVKAFLRLRFLQY
jgi:hypothetical protein